MRTTNEEFITQNLFKSWLAASSKASKCNGTIYGPIITGMDEEQAGWESDPIDTQACGEV